MKTIALLLGALTLCLIVGVLVAPPVGPVEPEGPFFGVDADHLSPVQEDGSIVLVDGEGRRQIDYQTALDLVGQRPASPTLPDDKDHWRLTVIGSDEQRRQVVEDLAKHADLAEWRSKLVTNAYPPDHWAVKGVGFVTTGTPSIYLQLPSGKVLHRQTNYEGGAEALATAIRKADPNYDPAKDPDKRKPAPAPAPAPDGPGVPPGQSTPWGLVILAVAVILGGAWVLTSRKDGVR